MKTLRIFISSPGDVTRERERAREVVESLRRRFSRHFMLQPVLWEDLPLQSDMSFQRGIDAVLSEKGVDIAIFILWSRLGTPLGHAIPRPDGTPYLSGTEREFDLIMQARATSLEKEGTARPAVLVYTRRDDASFEEALRGTSTEKKEELIEQKKRVESFLAETFRDKETGVNIGAYFPFDRPVTFSQRLRTHLQGLLDEIAGESTEVVWDIDKQGPPFLGLEAFQPEHAAVFFGREEEILEARHALKEQAKEGCAFLLLSGASGSGKSSLARAGVLPAIVELEVDEQVAAWSSLVLTPSQLGPDPIAALVAHLADEQHLPSLAGSSSSLPDLVAGLKKDPDLTFNLRLKEAFAKSATKHGGSVRLLLVLDQLEEFFTTAALSADDQAAFFAVVETFARSGCVWVLATLRSDFYEQVQNEPALVRMKSGHGQLDVLPPGPDALARLIEEPARLAGLTFERRDDQVLSSRIIKDAASHAELLPLVEFVLRELFERRSDNHLLTFAAYEELGGVEGALAKRAEDTYAALPVDSESALDELLPLLISVDITADQNAVRRRAVISELSATPARRQLTEALIAARFLTTGEQDGTAVASLAHEALLRRWDRLKEWTDRNRDLLRLRATVEQSERRWHSGDRDRSLLLSPGLPLEEGRRLLRDGRHLLDGTTRDYIEVSIAQSEADEARRVKLRRGVIASLSVLTVVALGAAGWAVLKQREARTAEAQTEMQLVETQRQLERSRLEEGRAWLERAKLAWEAEKDPLTALMLAGRAVGFHGFGRRENESPDLVAAFPDMLGKPMTTDPEIEAARQMEVEAVRDFVGGVRPTCLPIWSTTVQNHYMGGGNSVAFSPDGTRLASGSEDTTVKVWNVATGKQVATLAGHSETVRSVAFSPDGTRLASGSSDHTIKLWDVSTGVATATLLGHSEMINSVAFSPDGTQVASASDDDTVKLWEVATGNLVATLAGHTKSVYTVAFSLDGTRLATGSLDDTVKLWNAATGKAVHTLAGHKGYVTSVAFCPDGVRLASGSFDQTVKLWEAGTGKAVATLTGHTKEVRSVSFDPSGTRLVSGSSDNTVKLWDVSETWETGKVIASLTGHTDPLIGVAYSPAGRRVASSSSDNTVKLWDVATSIAANILLGHTDPVKDITFSPDGTLAASVGGWEVKLWDVVTGKELATLRGHSGPVMCVAFSPDGRRVISGSWDKTVKLWDVATGEVVVSFTGHSETVMSVSFSPDGTLVAGASSEQTVKLWDVATGAEVLDKPDFSLAAGDHTVSPDRGLKSEIEGNVIRLYSTADAKDPDLLHFQREGLFRLDGRKVEWTTNPALFSSLTAQHYRDDELAALAAPDLQPATASALRLQLMARNGQWRAARAWWAEAASGGGDATLRRPYLTLLLTTADYSSLAELTAEITANLTPETTADLRVSLPLAQMLQRMVFEGTSFEPVWGEFVSKVSETTSRSWQEGVAAHARKRRDGVGVHAVAQKRLDDLINLIRSR